jgi:hypothetical protein
MAATEKDLRDRTLLMLSSKSAQKVEFTFDGLYFTGAYFSAVALAIVLKPQFHRGIGFRTGHVAADADAQYDPADDVIDVPNYAYGTTTGDRDSIVHECFHAWRDAVGAKAPTATGSVATTALTDEAMAYIVGALFTNYDLTPAGRAPTMPYWATAGTIYAEAHRIAATLMGVKNPVVSAADVTALKDKIKASPTYRALKANPAMSYGNNGL